MHVLLTVCLLLFGHLYGKWKRGQWTAAYDERDHGGQVDIKKRIMRGISYSAIACSSMRGDFESMMEVSASANMCHAVLSKTIRNSSDFVVQNDRAFFHLITFPARVPFLK